ncbi:uncharacterized protein [Coffea arabica]|uniref:Uncharacterized protein isoform X2 n=1 Tax=Coffea arabica TaxID=13443 RepID=A0A6P6XFP6_COFAR|nr:uncharacterized protein LOC113741483 isoform X1 [Coffea arabica]
MAACGFGASGLKISSLNLGSARPKFSALQPLNGFPVGILKFNQFDGLEIVSARSRRAVAGCKFSASEAILTITAKTDDSPEGIRSSNGASKLILNSFEVESLIKEVCDTTSIAELELKLGGFRLYVMRNLAVPTPASAPISVNTAIDVPNENGSASSTSLAISKSEPSPSDIQTSLVKAADEGLVMLQSPRVGFFRRSRTIKGKRAPPSCKKKQQVKEGQVLCFIEQLGGEIPIESDVSGEVVKILREDGEPVGYGDALIAILPSFPGIKNL